MSNEVVVYLVVIAVVIALISLVAISICKNPAVGWFIDIAGLLILASSAVVYACNNVEDKRIATGIGVICICWVFHSVLMFFLTLYKHTNFTGCRK